MIRHYERCARECLFRWRQGASPTEAEVTDLALSLRLAALRWLDEISDRQSAALPA